jgi:hypothetical protein
MLTKDITFLLRLLGSSKQSGVLFVEAPGPDESPWQGQFQLNNGTVISCALLNKADGRLVLTNEDALAWITRQGKLSWHLEEAAPPLEPAFQLLPPGGETPRGGRHREEYLPPPPLPRNQPGTIPQRTPKGKLVPGNTFASREHRQVFALVDGQRTIEEIAQLLHRPSDFIISVLQELRAAGFIT